MSKIRKRQANLLALIAIFPLSVKALAMSLGVSDQTVILDINYLSSTKKLIINPKVKGKLSAMTVQAL